MTEQKHTPGPWRKVHDHPCPDTAKSVAYIRPCKKYTGYQFDIATVYGCNGVWDGDMEPESNAHLIAAAPDMLGASPRAVKMLRIAAQLIADSKAVDHSIFYDDAECDGYCVIEDCEMAADELEAAIAKAKGETE